MVKPRGAGETVWCYLVVSSAPQAPSLAEQRTWAQGEADAHGWQIGRTLEGVASGKAGPRTIMRTLLAELRALPPESRPTFVLCTRLDRVARGPIVETQLVVHDLGELGVRLWERDHGELRNETAMEQLMVAIKATVAAQENEVKSDKRRAVVARKRAAGLPIAQQQPYGLAIDPATKRHVPREPQATAVREAFRLRLQSAGYHAIGKHLHATAPPYEYRNGKVQHMRWSTTAVSRLLSNRSYRGTVVDELTFERAQRIRANRALTWPPRPARHPWPLSGALRCWCGGAMTASTGGKNLANRIRYYTCRNAAAHEGFRFRRERADRLEAAFVALLHQLRRTPELIAAYRARAAEPASTAMLEPAIQRAKAEVTALRGQRDSVWAMHARGMIRDEDVQERLDALAARRDELEARIADLESQRVVASAIRTEELEDAAVVERAAAVYEEATVGDQRLIAVDVARRLGGLCVERDGTLTVRTVTPLRPRRQAEREAGARRDTG